MPNGKGFYDFQQPMSKTQPAKNKDRPSQTVGDGHDFNKKAKVTNAGSGYNDLGPGGSRKFNGSEKDASIDYLTTRGKKGIEVRNYSGTKDHHKEHTNNVGTTAYNSRPIEQTYKSATSHGVPAQDQIVYETKTKDVLKG